MTNNEAADTKATHGKLTPAEQIQAAQSDFDGDYTWAMLKCHKEIEAAMVRYNAAISEAHRKYNVSVEKAKAAQWDECK